MTTKSFEQLKTTSNKMKVNVSGISATAQTDPGASGETIICTAGAIGTLPETTGSDGYSV